MQQLLHSICDNCYMSIGGRIGIENRELNIGQICRGSNRTNAQLPNSEFMRSEQQSTTSFLVDNLRRWSPVRRVAAAPISSFAQQVCRA
jgi:hypothetical protein